MATATTMCPVHPGDDPSLAPPTSTEDAIDHSKLIEIPQPPTQHYFGLLGHVPEIDPGFPLRSYWKMMDLYGPIFQLRMGGPRILVGNHELVSELLACDDRFQKIPTRIQQEMRCFFGDGLFTAYLEEKNWWKAHRLLIPAFGPLGLRRMFDDMMEISSQMILMWDRFGPDHEIDCIEDVTRLTFDTIGLCGFGFRFNEFYTDEPHPFAKQLQEALFESALQFHRDRKVWGDDADEFRPERMLDGGFQALPPNSWKPFGDGLRACIGRGFAEQEMLINLAMVLQRFQIEKAVPEYNLELKSTLTIKPVNFKMKVRRRPGRSLMTGLPGGGPAESAKKHRHEHEKAQQQGTYSRDEMKPVSILYGGNTGTCESLAFGLSKSASDLGFATHVQNLDTATENLPTDRSCVIITPSYEGKPPDNAKKFVAWIEQLMSMSKKLPMGMKYAVFGVGNSDWANTFHRVPQLIDETLAKLGAERIIDAGFANVKQDLVGPWEEWSEQLCVSLSGTTQASRPTAGVNVSFDSKQDGDLLGDEEVAAGTVMVNEELADTSAGAAKRHVEIRLPPGSDYTSGDYLFTRCRNPDESVRRARMRFGLSGEEVMSVQGSKKEFLPSRPMVVDRFLQSNVELATPITKRQLGTLASFATEGSAERTQLEKMQEDIRYQELLDKRYSVIDVLEEVPQLVVPFGVYIDMLLPLTPRQYSISSSPLHSKNSPGSSEAEDAPIASITFDVFESPATSGHGTFRGVASSHLANRRPGDLVPCFVRPTNVDFRLPPNTETPVIMLSAGTGIAPMRGFIQERAAIKRAGVRKLVPAILFFGCRHPDKDYIYRHELAEWESEGVVEVIPCFSKPGNGQPGRHVPDALWEHRSRVWDMFRDGGNIYLCGSAARLGRSAAEMCRRIWREKTGKSELEAEEWLEQVKNDRYVSDVY